MFLCLCIALSETSVGLHHVILRVGPLKVTQTEIQGSFFWLANNMVDLYEVMAPSSDPQSRTSTPRSFTTQSASAEDLLKSQTVGLVHLSDFRKRRAEVLERKEREAHDKSLGRFISGTSRSATPSTGDLTDR